MTAKRRRLPDLDAAAKAKMLRDLERASELGHTLGAFEQKLTTKTQYGFVALCSCGFRTTPKRWKARALAAAYMHVGEVLVDAGDTPTVVDVPQTVGPPWQAPT